MLRANLFQGPVNSPTPIASTSTSSVLLDDPIDLTGSVPFLVDESPVVLTYYDPDNTGIVVAIHHYDQYSQHTQPMFFMERPAELHPGLTTQLIDVAGTYKLIPAAPGNVRVTAIRSKLPQTPTMIVNSYGGAQGAQGPAGADGTTLLDGYLFATVAALVDMEVGNINIPFTSTLADINPDNTYSWDGTTFTAINGTFDISVELTILFLNGAQANQSAEVRLISTDGTSRHSSRITWDGTAGNGGGLNEWKTIVVSGVAIAGDAARGAFNVMTILSGAGVANSVFIAPGSRFIARRIQP